MRLGVQDFGPDAHRDFLKSVWVLGWLSNCEFTAPAAWCPTAAEPNT